MKKLLLYSFFAFAIASALVSCKQDSASIENPIMPMTTKTTTTAHPAITYIATPIINNKNYYAVGVMDTDGTHQTNLVIAGATTETFLTPAWSPSGGSIAYYDFTSNLNSAIKAFDVSVNSSGVAVSSNARTIYSVSTSDSVNLRGPAWCSVSSTGKVAFIRQHVGSKLGLSELCTISESGGTVTVLTSYQKVLTINGHKVVQSNFSSPTWNPDDSKIAVIRADTNGSPAHNTILIIDASTGTIKDSIPIAAAIRNLEWSRTGTNKLVYMYTPNSSTAWSLYYVTPTTGSTPSTNSVTGNYPTWSPNNSGILYTNSALMKVIPLTSTTTTVNTSPGGSSLNWKK